MESENAGLMQNQTYQVRPGTVQLGIMYEEHLVTLFTIRGARSPTHDMWIAKNVEGCASFDDIVIFRKDKSSSKTEGFMLQCKHSDRSRSISLREFFPNREYLRDFSLTKYNTDYGNIKCSLDRDIWWRTFYNEMHLNIEDLSFIIFTNRPVDDNCLPILENMNHPFLNTKKGKVFKFKYEELLAKSPLEQNPPYDSNFVNQLMLFSNQVHDNEIVSYIVTELSQLLQPIKLPRYVLHEIVKKYISFISEWSKGKLGGHYILSTEHVVTKLSELLLERYMRQFYTSKYNVNTCYDYYKWDTILQDRNVTEIEINFENDSEVMHLLYRYLDWSLSEYKKNLRNSHTADWEQEFSRQETNRFYEHIDVSLKEEMIRTMSSNDGVTLYHVYRALWKIKKIPIVLEVTNGEDYSAVLHILSLSKFTLKAIILKKFNSQALPSPNISKHIFSNLADLNEDIRKSILEEMMELQGRPIQLKHLIENQTELITAIGAFDIMQILTGNFNIGNTINKLPKYHIERTIPRILIDISLLLEALEYSKDIFMIHCHDKSTFLKSLGELNAQLDSSYVADYEAVETLNRIPNNYKIIIKPSTCTPTNQNLKDKTVHQLILHQNYSLEWINTIGSTNTINSLRCVQSNNCNIAPIYAKDILTHFKSKINIISADPGMGKSVMMDHIAQLTPTDTWVLRINLSQHLNYYGNEQFKVTVEDCTKHIHYFNSQVQNKQRINPINKNIFNTFLSSNSILLLLDGFDEVPQYYTENLIGMIKSFLSKGYRIWITTRPNLQAYLEKEFNTFALTLNPFTQNNQIRFLTQYYQSIMDSNANVEDTVAKFAEQLLERSHTNLNDWGQHFTGVPLQIKLLAECFEDECKNFLEGQTIIKNFNLLDLYTKFTQKKIMIAEEKYGPYGNQILFDKYHQLCSLQVLFNDNDLKELQIDQELAKLKDKENYAEECLRRSGIAIVKNELTLDFAHRTFAEYFAAKWLSANHAHTNARKLIKKIFEREYSITRNIFDQLLAEDRPLHIAIIHQQLNEARTLIEQNPELLNSRDAGGRLPVHLAAAWGARHPITKPGETIDPNIHKAETNNVALDTFLLEICSSMKEFPKDNILQFTPIDYAVASDSLSNLNSILSSSNFSQRISLGGNNIKDYIYYSSRYGYEFLLKRILQRYNVQQLHLYINSSLDKVFNRTAVHWLSVTGHEHIILSLLQAGNDSTTPIEENKTLNHLILCKTDADGKTALHLATENKHSTTASLLLSHGANTETQDKNCRTALHLGAQNGDNNILKLLLEKSCVNVQDGDSNTALHLAAMQGHTDTVSLLLNKKADTNLKNKSGRTALHMATIKDHIDTMRCLLKYDNRLVDETDNKGNTALHLAAEHGHLGAVELLLSTNNVKRDVKNNAGKAILHLAAGNGHKIIVSLLVSNTDVNIKDNEGNTPLHLAARQNHEATVSVLLNFRACVNIQNNRGRTALHESAINNCKEVAMLLLSNGADLNIKDDNNRTALHLAAKSNGINVAELLLYKNMDTNDKDSEGNTPLHLAVLEGHTHVITLLLDTRNINRHTVINVNTKNELGKTVLHLAAETGYYSIANLLIEYGINIKATDNFGNSAAELANINNHNDISRLLRSKGDDLFI